MRWSIEELIEALRLYKSYGFWRWFKELPSRIYRRTIVFFKWLFTGYTDVSIWSLYTFLIDIIIFRLDKFIRDADKSYPYECEDHQGWVEILKEMQEAFVNMKGQKIISNTLSLIERPEPMFIKVEDFGYTLNPYNDEDKIKINKARKLQEENDKKALKMFGKYFQDLWD